MSKTLRAVPLTCSKVSGNVFHEADCGFFIVDSGASMSILEFGRGEVRPGDPVPGRAVVEGGKCIQDIAVRDLAIPPRVGVDASREIVCVLSKQSRSPATH